VTKPIWDKNAILISSKKVIEIFVLLQITQLFITTPSPFSSGLTRSTCANKEDVDVTQQ
jgi:hypothetical protein